MYNDISTPQYYGIVQIIIVENKSYISINFIFENVFRPTEYHKV